MRIESKPGGEDMGDGDDMYLAKMPRKRRR